MTATRQGNDHMTDTTFSPREFRDALGAFATGVTIVTARDETGEPVGMTASSFNSVSVDPPLILWSVTKAALSASAFHRAENFVVHVLGSAQVELSNRFARSGEDKFGGITVAENAAGVPLLPDPVARFHCRQWAVYEGGDHWIIVGEVEQLERRNADSLVFCGGSYASAHPLRAPASASAETASAESAIDGLLIYNLARAFHQMAGEFHDSVRASGLSVPEWRVLASLHGEVSRTMADLSARTFVAPVPLKDMVLTLQDAGLCRLDEQQDPARVTGTPQGHQRVEHLFALGQQQEAQALDDQTDAALPGLITLLQQIIKNTRAVT